MRLVHDLKEEGNALFKENHYDIAWMHYRNAIFIVGILENRFYHIVEKDFTSSLFSNRAFCCLKKVVMRMMLFFSPQFTGICMWIVLRNMDSQNSFNALG